MDSKGPPDYSDHPPPYTTTPSGPSSTSTPAFHPSFLTSHLQSHLASIPDRIRQTKQARNAHQTAADIALLDHLVPLVEAFLAELGEQLAAPPLATLTIVPGAAVPPDATLSDLDEMRRRGEVGRVCRLDMAPAAKMHGGGTDTKARPPLVEQYGSSSSSSYGGGDDSWTPGREFTDWGRWDSATDDGDFGSSGAATSSAKLLWWRDEPTARRLAAYLQPPKPQAKSRRTAPQQQRPTDTARTAVQAAVEQRIPAEREKKSWGWGRRRERNASSGGSSPVPSTPVGGPERSAARGTVAGGDVAGVPEAGALPVDDGEEQAEMTVGAHEVAFRRENEFGILEGIGGWAIVVSVVVKT